MAGCVERAVEPSSLRCAGRMFRLTAVSCLRMRTPGPRVREVLIGVRPSAGPVAFAAPRIGVGFRPFPLRRERVRFARVCIALPDCGIGPTFRIEAGAEPPKRPRAADSLDCLRLHRPAAPGSPTRARARSFIHESGLMDSRQSFTISPFCVGLWDSCRYVHSCGSRDSHDASQRWNTMQHRIDENGRSFTVNADGITFDGTRFGFADERYIRDESIPGGPVPDSHRAAFASMRVSELVADLAEYFGPRCQESDDGVRFIFSAYVPETKTLYFGCQPTDATDWVSLAIAFEGDAPTDSELHDALITEQCSPVSRVVIADRLA
jgi:hypothetical protein